MKPLQELMKKEKLAVILLTGLLLLIVALPVREEDKEEEQTLPQKEPSPDRLRPVPPPGRL